MRRPKILREKRPEVLVCLDYEDLSSVGYVSLKNRQKSMSDALEDLLCSNKGRLGCKCRPKCSWIRKWMTSKQYSNTFFNMP